MRRILWSLQPPGKLLADLNWENKTSFDYLCRQSSFETTLEIGGMAEEPAEGPRRGVLVRVAALREENTPTLPLPYPGILVNGRPV